MDKATPLIIYFFAGCLLVLIVTHAPGFVASFNSVASGVNGLGTTLTGANVANGAYPAGTVLAKK